MTDVAWCCYETYFIKQPMLLHLYLY